MIIVAGHVCLDIIPAFLNRAPLDPGSLVRVGAAMLATGGVSNVGVALHRLGVPVRLIHKIGDDLFGSAIRSLFAGLSSDLASGLRMVPGETTSYSLVIAPPGMDRMFIHCPGANDSFTEDDITAASLTGGTHFHLGYPPVMRSLLINDGAGCAAILAKARSAGLTTSLDLCSIDPESAAGKMDWTAWLKTVLPQVDYFVPSFDELTAALAGPGNATKTSVRNLATRCVAMGAKQVLIKLGDQGLFFADKTIEAHNPCLAVDVVSTNGAGDCTVAGYLAASVMNAWPIHQQLEFACAAGAACCEAADATSGVHSQSVLRERLASGWARRPTSVNWELNDVPRRNA